MSISSVNVKNYKTIKDASVSFKPGLNIIIGDNGSGKTNFVDILDDVLSVAQYGGYNNFDVAISFANGLNLHVQNIIDIRNDNAQFGESYTEYTISTDKFQNKPLNTGRELAIQYYAIDQLFFSHNIIRHGIPKESLFLDAQINNSIQISSDNPEIYVLQLLSVGQHETFFASFLKNALASTLKNHLPNTTDIKSQWINIVEQFLSAIKRKINYAPFADIRLSENFTISYSLTESTITVSNLYFEFFQNNRWNSFQQLSDGTKRLVIIFFSLFDSFELLPIDEKKSYNNKGRIRDTTIIIEEPELGIHPNQLYQLMLLLEQEAKTKQIIITTHSPVALDILEKDSLDSIIICAFDNERGTTLNHLTEKQREKAVGYLENVGYLSLYWTHSDLNRAKR